MGEIIKGYNLLEQFKSGMLSKDNAISQQRTKFTGKVTQMEGVENGGWKVLFNDGTERTFDNLGAVVEWARENNGLIYKEDGHTKLAGQTIKELLGE